MSGLAELRRSAELGMTQDAAPAHAAAREKLLQLYRDAWIERQHLELGGAPRSEPMGEADLAGIDWIARLAQAGHAPAAHLLERALQPVHIDSLLKVAPQRILAMAPAVPVLAAYLAWHELRKPLPDLKWLREWQGGDYELGKLLEALGELAAIVGQPDEGDFAIVREPLSDHAPGEFALGEYWPDKLLLAFARRRAGSDAGQRLLERAAALGSDEAAEELFTVAFGAAPDKERFLREWFAAGKAMAQSAIAPCMQVGAALEHAGRFDEAVQWYERAMRKATRNRMETLDKEFCYAVAHAFDKRWSRLVFDDAELALKWHARAADAGDERCLDTWLLTCMRGEMGLAPDPAAALERVRRFRASGVDMGPRRWRLAGAIKAMSAAADPRWSEVVALLEK